MPHRIALLGDPVAHSLSPRLHNTAFSAAGLDWEYVPCRVAPEHLAETVAQMHAQGFVGANVTIPHKEAVAEHMDALTERAEAVGAVNTICVEAGDDGAVRLVGDNTDIAGFLAPLRELREEAPALESLLRGCEMVVFGAGGAARAVVYAALTALAPSRLTLAARTPKRAKALAKAMQRFDDDGVLEVVALDDAAERVRSAALVVNATPLGMHAPGEAGGDASPWPHPDDFHPGQIAYDLVYAPATTRFLRDAASRGATPIGGMPMLIGQAAASFERWTGAAWPLAADAMPD